MDSKPMKWSELRERLDAMIHHSDSGRRALQEMASGKVAWTAEELCTLPILLADIDAAAPAMEAQEQSAALFDLAVENEGSLWADEYFALLQQKEESEANGGADDRPA